MEMKASFSLASWVDVLLSSVTVLTLERERQVSLCSYISCCHLYMKSKKGYFVLEYNNHYTLSSSDSVSAMVILY